MNWKAIAGIAAVIVVVAAIVFVASPTGPASEESDAIWEKRGISLEELDIYSVGLDDAEAIETELEAVYESSSGTSKEYAATQLKFAGLVKSIARLNLLFEEENKIDWITASTEEKCFARGTVDSIASELETAVSLKEDLSSSVEVFISANPEYDYLAGLPETASGAEELLGSYKEQSVDLELLCGSEVEE